ncbi:centrosome-associated protein 350-like isoform X2 [Denticeps clupeoides]|uniref:centrosome-associated protein 350-like isoform X2 n=1 Tax=Denticeps clupeoides TaxID=299321 RepID=UPI0010A4EC1B|nr:centrosome-associated protein 350-like isoform X2 [Denticeps clupeoides]
MWGQKWDEAQVASTCPAPVHDSAGELTSAMKSLNQTKAALRHIENQLEAVPGTGVMLDSVMGTKKPGASRKSARRDGRHSNNASKSGSHHSPEKSSRSPLRNTTMDSNTRRAGGVEFREPVASYREVSPPPVQALVSEAGSSVVEPNGGLSQLVYQSDTRDLQSLDLDSPLSSTLDSVAVRHLNDKSAIDAVHQPPPESSVRLEPPQCLISPGSSSQRLENLRRRQHDEKLEKLKERIRRQREHLEEAAERKKLLGYLEQPVGIGRTASGGVTAAKVRKVTYAPPAPIYKGFNTSEAKPQAVDGKPWKEKDQSLKGEIYRDLTWKIAESSRPRLRVGEHAEEKKPAKPVRKVHRSASAPEHKNRPAISTSSWRDGQKLVKMVLGHPPRVERESRPQSADKAFPARSRSSSAKTSQQNARPRPASAERQSNSQPAEEQQPLPEEEKCSSVDHLQSANIRSILNDLELEHQPAELDSEVTRRAVVHKSRTLTSNSGPVKTAAASEGLDPVPKNRHYDADTVRQYIAKQQVERRRRHAEERRAQREEAERRNQRLQELYKKQREGVTKSQTVAVPTEGAVQKKFQETYTKLLLEQSLLDPPTILQRPIYQPSGESDKENKRHERPNSASSSSDLSGPELQPLFRNALGLPTSPSWLHMDGRSLVGRSGLETPLAPPSGQLFSKLLALDATKTPYVDVFTPSATLAPPSLSHSRVDRIEALKATAAALSNRIETQARQLVATGAFNHGCDVDQSTDLLLQPQPPPQDFYGGSVSVLCQDSTGCDAVTQRIDQLLRVGQTIYDDPLPGVGNLSIIHREQQEEALTSMPAPAVLSLSSPEGLPPWQEPHFEPGDGQSPRHHDTSGSSISEGPLLSEGSFSEEDSTCHPNPEVLQKPSRNITQLDFCSNRMHNQPVDQVSRFIREAEGCPGVNLETLGKDCSAGPLEDLAKGSPNSVVNIFLKNLPRNHQGFNGSNDVSSPALVNSADEHLYEDDFSISRCNGGSGQSSKRSPSLYSSSAVNGVRSAHSSPASSPPSGVSSLLSKGTERSECSVLEGLSVLSAQSVDSRRANSQRSSSHSTLKSTGTGDTAAGASVHSTIGGDRKTSPRSPAHFDGSPPQSVSPKVLDSGATPVSPGSLHVTSTGSRRKTSPHPISPTPRLGPKSAGDLQYGPGVLQQRMQVSLSFLDALEVSMHQLDDVERVRGVSLAQQESVSLASLLKAQQQRHERDLHLLKVKAEQEALEASRQLEETRQAAARQGIVGGLQDISKKFSHQMEPVPYTDKDARHIKEMTELACSQISSIPAPSRTNRTEAELPSPPQDSNSNSLPTISGGGSAHLNASLPREKISAMRKSASGSPEDTVADKSIPSDALHSLPDEKDSMSAVTEYSLKFDESMTEDEIEERSFRSLLPSESHRRCSLEKKQAPHEESDEEMSPEQSVPQDMPKSHCLSQRQQQQEGSGPFSGGQNSFSEFTMAMVRQYMQEEEVRAQHQSSLLKLRERALREKTRAELAWLEHQKRQLRDKGEDDKMPPLRKKQRGLLLKLQQEQAEIKRLQEAHRAARRERQLLLKQQKEIERMRHSTLKLKEKLKSAGDHHLESPVSEAADVTVPPSVTVTDADSRSPSPVSMSGSETSSIMEKLRKMRSQMDEKHCSPVHCFFSVFTAHHWASLCVCFPKLHPKFQLFIYQQLVRFLTKREQQLMQRRYHAEELLQWKQRLDAEELEVRQMEKEAVAAWDREKTITTANEASDPVLVQRESGGEDVGSVALSMSSVTSDLSVPERLVSASAETPAKHRASQHPDPASLVQDQRSDSRPPSSARASLSTSRQLDSSRRSSSGESTAAGRMHFHTDPASTTQSEPTSDQSDIESRIRALKEELRKRKSVVYQLKKEQKKRQKERLKAQEASLLKQLESYNNFIQKTKAELSKDPDNTEGNKPQIKTPTSASEKSKIQTAPSQRPESNSWTPGRTAELDKHEEVLPESPAATSDHSGYGHSSIQEGISLDEDPPTVTPTPVSGSPEHTSGLNSRMSPRPAEDMEAPPSAQVSLISSHRSEVMEELDCGQSDQLSGALLNLEAMAEARLQPSEVENCVTPEKAALESDHSVETRSDIQNNKNIEPLSMQAEVQDEQMMKEMIPERLFQAAESADKEVQSKHETSAQSAEAYNEDFESTIGSDEMKFSKPTSQYPPELQDESRNKSPFYTTEEDIDEEFSVKTESVNGSAHSRGLLDLRSPEGQSADEEVVSPAHVLLSSTGDEMGTFSIGDRVVVSNVQPGTLRFKGRTDFASGFWAGVELDKPEGSNNGTYDGVVYFKCKDRHGIFAPPDKVSHLSEKIEIYVDTTEDEDSFSEDHPMKEPKKDLHKELAQDHDHLNEEKSDTGFLMEGAGLYKQSELNGEKLELHGTDDYCREDNHDLRSRDIILEIEDAPAHNTGVHIPDISESVFKKHVLDETKPSAINDLLANNKRHTVPVEIFTDEKHEAEDTGEKVTLNALAENLVNNFVKDAVKQFQEIKKTKEEKILASNQSESDIFSHDEWFTEKRPMSSFTPKNAFPSFFDEDKEEISSPQHCNRVESPVLGASGQEELAKRLAELELSRELLDVLGDEQDWFDEDFGLSSRKEQQKQLQRREGVMGAEVEQVKIPTRPELPLQPKSTPEEQSMVVPHTLPEVEELVHAATQEIWETCGLAQGVAALEGRSKPQPSASFLGEDARGEDQDSQCRRSYKQAVFDLSWEVIKDIFAEDPNAGQPQWAKPRWVNTSYVHRMKSPGDIGNVRSFITAEVLKLYGLKKEHNQKTDWQKMLKFGRKKRDRVDHILVQELHEEESQWVNYDEDELYVKMQLADGIFDALLKDTVDILSQIQEKRLNRSASS